MPETELFTAYEVIDQLGGPRRAATLLKVHPKLVYHWRDIDAFPSHMYVKMSVTLLRRGYYARPHLWNMTE